MVGLRLITAKILRLLRLRHADSQGAHWKKDLKNIPCSLEDPLSPSTQLHYQEILEDQTELICRYLADTTILYVNPAYCRYFGLEQNDLIGNSYAPIIYEADREAVHRQVQAMTCDNPQVTIENRVVVKGEVRWTQWNNRCFCDENGQIIVYQSVGRDITQLKTVEAELQASEHRYRSLIEAIPQLVWVAEADGITRIDFNQRWFDFTGRSPSDVMNDGWLAVVHPDDREVALGEWQNAIANDTPYEAEYRLRRADGCFVWHLAKAEPLYDKQGSVFRWYGTCTDISDRKRIEAKHIKAEADLHCLNQTLEQRVAERTAEIATTNQALSQEIDERQQAEQQLKEGEEGFRQAIRDAPFPIIIHAEDGRILQMSQSVLDITGYSEDEIQTLDDWLSRAYGERKSDVSAQVNRLYELETRLDEGEFTVRTKAQALRTWMFSSAPLGRLADGKRLVISMAADVTEQKRTEAALATRLRQQAVITQLSQTALQGLNLDVLFQQAARLAAVSLSVEFAKVLQLSPDAQSFWLRAGVGWDADVVGHEIVQADSNSQAGYTLLSQQPVIVEDLRTETRFSGPPLLTQHGVVSGMSTIIYGASDRPFGILGAHSTEQRSFTQDDVNFLQAIANLLAAAINRKQTEQQLLKLNQTLEQRVRDRTQALEDVNRELESFSYSVAHDLRAPLRAIQGFAQVLAEDYDPVLDDLGKEYIHRMGTSAEHLDLLVEDLLAYSQLGRTDIHVQPVNTEKVIHDILEDRESLITAKQACIEVASEMPTVYAQRSVLKQVLSNLIDNSLKFVEPDTPPQIHIWSTIYDLQREDSLPCQKWARLWVADQGIGISHHHQERIFNAFERLHGVEAYAGTGIGLAIVKRGVERLGGRVGVESEPDRGSRFWIELPMLNVHIHSSGCEEG